MIVSNSKSKVYFFFDNVRFTLKTHKKLKIFIASLFINEKRQLDFLNYIFCTDNRILKINKEFLKHNYVTDIITFDLCLSPNMIAAEVYISIENVKENAKGLKINFEKELMRVIFHGALHLCGYNDKNPQQIKRMRAREEYYLKKWDEKSST